MGSDHLLVSRWTRTGIEPFEFRMMAAPDAGAVLTADLDDDGRLDLAELSSQSAQVAIVFNALPPALPTPVLAAVVRARVVGGRVEVEWQMNGAVSVTIERSADGAAWTAVATASPDGMSRVTYADSDVVPGATYGYRLRVDAGGRTVMLAATSVAVPTSTRAALRAVGAPRTSVELELSSHAAGDARVDLFDVAGRRVETKLISLEAGQTRHVSMGRSLAPGLYLARARMAACVARVRVAVVR